MSHYTGGTIWSSGTIGVIFGTSLVTAANFAVLPNTTIAPIGTIFGIKVDPDNHPSSTLSGAWCSNNTTPPPGSSLFADPIGKGSYSFSPRPSGVNYIALWQNGTNFGSGLVIAYGFTIVNNRMIFVVT